MAEIGTGVVVIFFFGIVAFPKESMGLRLTKVDVPGIVAREDAATLSCEYDLNKDSLYSVLWYKDHEEFYRYVPRNEPKQHSYEIEGFRVVTQKSNDHLVFLQNITLKASGIYRCEVSAEAPSFASVHGEGRMDVIALPSDDPIITGEDKILRIGDVLRLNCTSGKSYPPARLNWFVNGQQADSNYEIEFQHQDLLSSVSNLNLKILPRHFKRGSLLIRCVSTVFFKSLTLQDDDKTGLVIDRREALFQVKGSGTIPSMSKWMFVPILMVFLT